MAGLVGGLRDGANHDGSSTGIFTDRLAVVERLLHRADQHGLRNGRRTTRAWPSKLDDRDSGVTRYQARRDLTFG
jgi:catalase (peroxidase I)